MLNHLKKNTSSKITVENIRTILFKACGEKFPVNDVSIYEKSFTHTSMYQRHKFPINAKNLYDNNSVIDKKKIITETYERPEFLGDALLSLAVTTAIYEMFPDVGEGYLSNMRTMLVRSESCKRYAKFLDISKFIRVNKKLKHVSSLFQSESPKILEDVFEAFVAAIYLDTEGMAPGLGILYAVKFVQGVIRNVYGNKHRLAELLTVSDNHKERLSRIFQAFEWPSPKFYDCHDKSCDDSVYRCVYIPSNMAVYKKASWAPPTALDESSGTYAEDIYIYYENLKFIRCFDKGIRRKSAEQRASLVAVKKLEELLKNAGLSQRDIIFCVSN
jgi:dsRNA-specific ribonuclease